MAIVSVAAGARPANPDEARGALPANIPNSTINQAVTEDAGTALVVGRDRYPLSFSGLALSPAMRALIDRYTASYRGEDDADHWNVVSRDIAMFSPTTPADTAAKLMLGLHDLHPSEVDSGALAIDTAHFACDAAGEVLIATMNDLAASAVMTARIAAKPSSGAWRAAQLAFERADAALQACPANARSFDRLAMEAYNHRMALLLTPAPTAAELAYKLTEFRRNDARHLVRVDEITAVMEADARRLASLDQSASDDQWTRALAAFEAVNTALKTSGLTDERIGDLTDLECDAGRAVMALPARTVADVATKLRVQMKLAVMIEHDALTNVLVDLDRLQRETIEIGAEDPALVDAFETFREAFGELKAQDPDCGEKIEDRYYRLMDPADMILKTVPAQTPVGVVMKLKRAFVGMIPELWSDDAVFDDRPASFNEDVEKRDLYQEMLWRAIEDLERISTDGARSALSGEG